MTKRKHRRMSLWSMVTSWRHSPLEQLLHVRTMYTEKEVEYNCKQNIQRMTDDENSGRQRQKGVVRERR
jgi:hypothetical protein